VHWLRRLWPPLALFLLQRAAVAACAAWAGYSPFELSSYARWDSGYYLDIAAHGYAPLFHCTPETHYPSSEWCGNAGWFPGYPWAISVVSRIGLSTLATGFMLAAVSQLACLVLIWEWTRNGIALALGAFFPGSIYLVAVFPIGLFLFCALACLRWSSTGRNLLAAAGGCGAAMCHPLGPLLAPIVASRGLYRRAAGPFLVAGAVALGYAAVLLALHAQAGSWDAYFKTQAKYGYHLSLGVENLLAHLKPLVNPRYRDFKGFVTSLQTLLCTALMVGLAIRARRSGNPLLLLYVVAFWAAPLSLGGHLSFYRSEALLLPAAVLVPALPRALQISLLAAAVSISIPMSLLFFAGSLV
jgi:hypothetical protein